MSPQNGPNRSLFIILAVILAMLFCCTGVAAGLYFGWIVAPVQWVDMTPKALAEKFQVEYLRMAIDSFTVNQNCSTARERYTSLGGQRTQILQTIIAHPGEQKPEAISAFSKCVDR
jgi:hypothetical protein